MRKSLSAFLPLLLLLCAAASPAAARQGAVTPAAGSAERRGITNALRAPVERELKQKVIFKIDHLKLKGGWAFLRGVPQTPAGGKVDYGATPYRQRIDDGVFDDGVYALLKREGGRWRVVKYVIGPTDVAYEGWDAEYKAPAAIFR